MAIKNVTDQSFQNDVLAASEPVLVDFWAEWCGPCKQIGPALEELSADYGERLTIAKINIDENPQTPGQYGVRGIPTLMIFRNGELVASETGARPKGQIASWIDSVIADAGAPS